MKSPLFEELDALVKAEPAATPERDLVMVVDDDAGVLGALRRVLSDRFEILACRSGAEAVSRHTDRVRCIVLDVKMAGMDGFSACTKLQELDPMVPVVFHSAYQDAKDPIEIINDHHPFAYVTKDGDLQKLTRTIERGVRHNRILRLRRQTQDALGQVRAHFGDEPG